MPSTFQATGGYGVLICDASTGNVVEYHRENSDWKKPGDGYDDITRLDADEWRAAYPGETLEGSSHDILDFGSWDKSGTYCGPEQDWRDEFRRQRAECFPGWQAPGSAFEHWQTRALAYLKARYALEPNDIDADRLRRDFEAGETPREAIDFIAAKLGLIPAEDWTPERAAAFMSRFSALS